MKVEMKDTKFIVINFFFLVLAGSCSPNNRNQESEGSLKNDSILNAQVKTLVDSILSQHLGLELDSFILSRFLHDW